MKNGLKNKKLFSPSGLFFIIFFLLSGIALIYWFHASHTIPDFKNVNFKVNGKNLIIENNGEITLHPHDIVGIDKVNTTGFPYANIRLVSESIDAEALRYEPALLSGLLPGNEIFGHYLFNVQVYCRNNAIGRFDIIVRPYVEDWLQKAGKIIFPNSRAAFLEKAASFAPESREINQQLISAYLDAEMNSKAIEMLESEWNKREEQYTLMKLWELYKLTDNINGQISVTGRFVEKGWDTNKLWLAEQAAIFEKTGDIAGAVKNYEKLLDGLDEKESIPVIKHIAFLSAENDDFLNAVKYYLEAVKLGSDDPNIFYNLASIYERQGNFEEAGKTLAMAVGMTPHDIQNRLKLASEAAESKKWEEVIKWTDEILLIRPEFKDALILKAAALDAAGNKKELDDVYAKLLEIEPRNQIILSNRAVLALEFDNLTLSLELFRKYLEIVPEDREARALVFDILCREGRLEEATVEAKALLLVLPVEPLFFTVIGNLLAKAGNHVLLLNTMEEAFLSFPGNNEIKDLLLFAAVEIGDNNKLLEVIEKFLKDSPEDKKLLELQFFYCRKEGFNEKAADAALKNIGLGAGKKEMFHFLFEFFSSASDYEKILSIMKQALKQFPGEIGFMEYSAAALLQLNRYDDAIKILDKIVELNPGDTNSLFNMAILFEKVGRTEDARKIYGRILSVDPENRTAEEAYLRLSIELIE